MQHRQGIRTQQSKLAQCGFDPGGHEPQTPCSAFHPTSGTDIGGGHLETSDRQHSFNRCGVGGMRVRGIGSQPFAHCDPGDHHIGGGQSSGVSDIEQTRSATEMIGDIGEEIALTDKHRHRVAMGEVMQKRQKFMSHAIPQEHRIEVRRIEERNQPLGGAHSLGVGASQFDDRVPGTRADPGETIGAGTAQQIHENGLGPIISGVSERSIGAEDSVTGGAGPGLEVRPGFELHPLGPEISAESLCSLGDQSHLTL